MRAADRRELLLEAAAAEFAVGGLHGATTDAIARRAGISQPYVYRLFPSKKALFLAVVERAFDDVEAAFRAAVAAGADRPEDRLAAMGTAYGGLLADRDALLVQLHAYAATADPDVLAAVRTRYGRLFNLAEELSRAGADGVREFFAQGMLLNVVAALRMPEIAGDEEWARACLGTAPGAEPARADTA